MKIRGLHIEGFGLFRDTGIDDLPPTAVVIHGANEAGKSTMLAFIRSVLFGFPTARSARQHPPLGGGRHGGRLFLRTDDGREVTVERHHGKRLGPVTVALDDGSVRSDEPASIFTPGATRELFGNIYAFGLDELHEVKTLQGPNVRSVVYGASAGSVAASLPRVVAGFEQSRDRLFRPQGSAQTINRLIAELEEVRAKLRRAGSEMTDYEALALKLSSVDARIAALSQRIGQAGMSRQQLESRSRSWQDWAELVRAEQQLAAITLVVESFPDDGIRRLEVMLAELRKSREASNEARAYLESQTQELASLVVDEALIAAASVVHDIGERKSQFVTAAEGRTTIAHQMEAASADVVRELGNLGPDWTEERVLAVDRSLFTRQSIARFDERLAEVRRARERVAVTESARRLDASKASEDLERANARLAALGGDDDQIGDDIVRNVRAIRTDLATAASELPELERNNASLADELASSLRALGPDWSAERISAVDTTVATTTKIEEIERRLDAANRDVDQAATGATLAREALDAACAKADATRAAVASLPAPRTRKEIDADRAKARSLRGELGALEALRIRRDGLRATPKAAPAPQGRSLVPLGLALLVLTAIGFAAFMALGETITAVTFLVVLGTAGAAVLFLGRPATAPIVSEDDYRRGDAIAAAEAELARRQAELAQDWARLGAEGAPSSDGLEAFERQLDDEAAANERIDRERERCASLDVEVESARAAVAQREREVGSKQEIVSSTTDEWRAFAEGAGLGDVAPKAALAILRRVEATAELDRRHREAAVRAARFVETIEAARGALEWVPGLADVSGLKAPAIVAELDRYLEDADGRRMAHASREAATRDVDERRVRVREAEAELERAAAVLDDARRDESDACEEWSSWLAERGLPEHLLTTTARDALQAVEACAKAMQERERLRGELAIATEMAAAYFEEVGGLFDGIGRPRPEEASLTASVSRLLEDLRNARETGAARDRVTKSRADAEARSASADTVLTKSKRAIAELLTAARARDVETFRKRGAAFEERRNALRAVETAEARLRIATGLTTRDELRAAFGALSPDSIAGDIAAGAAEIDGANVELDRLRQERADTDAALRRLQAADSVAQLREAEERLLECIRVASREWSRYAIAAFLVEEAKRRFETEKQPAVIRAAARHFRTITGGRYSNVVAPIGETKVELVTATGERKSAENLSRGALEQLYLAIRFGYVENSSFGGETLPLVFDDILVNADPERARASVESILELSRRNQVLYFTCHPMTVDAFRDVDPKVAVLELRDGLMAWKRPVGSVRKERLQGV